MKNVSIFRRNRFLRVLLICLTLFLIILIYRVLSIFLIVKKVDNYNIIRGGCDLSIAEIKNAAQQNPTSYPLIELFEKISQSEEITNVILPLELKVSACDIKFLNKPYRIHPLEDLGRCFPSQEGISPGSSTAIILPTGPTFSQFIHSDIVAKAVAHISSRIKEPFHFATVEVDFSDRNWRNGIKDQQLTVSRVSGASACFPQGEIPLNDYLTSQNYSWANGQLNMLSNGDVTYKYALKKGLYQLRYEGYGTEAGGQFAQIRVQILNLHTARQAYGNEFTASGSLGVEKLEFEAPDDGHYQIKLSFINDAMIDGQDRNYFLKQVSLFTLPIPLGANPDHPPGFNRIMNNLSPIPTIKEAVIIFFGLLFIIGLILESFLDRFKNER